MAKQSAGLLIYRNGKGGPEVFLVHPGGPFWARRDADAWSIPKGEFGEDEDPLSAAIRECEEETGHKISGEFIPLTPVQQKGGKMIRAWAVEAAIDADNITSNQFEIEWPPRSGKMKSFPEVDRAEWFSLETAKEKINETQWLLVEELKRKLTHGS